MRRKDPQILRRARRRAELTQRELALLCKVSQTTIYLLERPGPGGMQTCSDDLAARVAKRLGRDVEDLFEAQGDVVMPVPATGNVAKRQSRRVPQRGQASRQAVA